MLRVLLAAWLLFASLASVSVSTWTYRARTQNWAGITSSSDGTKLALFFSVLATVAHAEVTWNQMGGDAGPARRVGRKLASSHVGDFTLVDISSTISTDYKFVGGAAASNGKIVFGPRNADGVGVFDPSDNSFELVDISSTIYVDIKFYSCLLYTSPSPRD